MITASTFVIVGASLAGAKAAETLRSEGFDGRVVLIGAEPDRPYERPPLSKGLLRGDDDRETIYVHPHEFYAEQDIELRTGATVSAIDTGASESSSPGASVCASTACCSPRAPSRDA